MDLRKWLLLNEWQKLKDLDDLIKYVPCSEFRSPDVLRLFAAGRRTGFLLTDADGQPTEALRLMVSFMPGVQLCTGRELPDEEKKAFATDVGTLVEVLVNTWYLRGMTDRIKAAFSSMRSWHHQWVWHFLPGLRCAQINYKDPDGKRRRRICYVASCPAEWELSEDVYHGLWRWNYGWRSARPADAYGYLESDATIEAPGGQGPGSRPAGEARAAS